MNQVAVTRQIASATSWYLLPLDAIADVEFQFPAAAVAADCPTVPAMRPDFRCVRAGLHVVCGGAGVSATGRDGGDGLVLAVAFRAVRE